MINATNNVAKILVKAWSWATSALTTNNTKGPHDLIANDSIHLKVVIMITFGYIDRNGVFGIR